MRRFAVPFAAICLLAADRAKDDAAGELKKLEGTWVLVEGKQDGVKIEPDAAAASRLVIKGDQHDLVLAETTLKGKHKVFPSLTPKAIDSTDTEGPFQGTTLQGIYELKGDMFTICINTSGGARPRKFEAPAGSGNLLHVWKRQMK